jgi:hypothetical protein
VTSRLYVSNWYGSRVEVYSQARRHRLIGFLNTYPYRPNSVHVDAAGDIWVALDTYTGPSIYVYKPGTTTPFRTLTGVTHNAVGIDVAKDGTAYVTDTCNGCKVGAPAEIWIFAPGSDMPTGMLTDSNGTCCGWVAVDDRGNVFLTYESKSGHTGAIDEFVKGSQTPKSLGITLDSSPGGIEVLRNGTLVVTEQGVHFTAYDVAASIDTFPKDATKPSSVIQGSARCDNWIGASLDQSEQTVYVGDVIEARLGCNEKHGAAGQIEQYTYPKGALLHIFNKGLYPQSGWYALVTAADPAAAP